MHHRHAPDTSPAVVPGAEAFSLLGAREIAVVLDELGARGLPLELRAADGDAVSAVLVPAAARPGTIALRSDAPAASLDRLRASAEIGARSWLDGVEIRFATRPLGPPAAGQELHCALPTELQRFQRRDAFRVRPLLRSGPCARLLRPGAAPLDLRVVDVSIGGCALFLPTELGELAAGTVLDGVELDLDADTRLQVRLRLLHATPPGAEARAARAGCAFVGLSGAAERALQRYVDATQKRARLLAGR